jgi:sphinganine C4-monooxygenase
MVFFTFSTIKTVDDHCGYALPWDPLQHLTGNNATYHDIHHQSWGIKNNFSQPFFTFWDAVLGTMWKGTDVKIRYEKARRVAEEWWAEQKAKAQADGTTLPEEGHSDQMLAQGGTEQASAPVLAAPTQAETPRVRRSPRKNNAAQFKGLRERVVNSGSLPNGVPRVESNR